MIKSILIANRGEIALRVVWACRDLGIKPVAVYSEADRDSLHVKFAEQDICIGPGPAKDSYLNIASVIAAAEAMKVDAIHPGYGFLSENAHFAEICESCGLIFIGPSPEHITRMGDKAEAKRVMAEAGLPLLPGSDGPVETAADATRIAAEVGYLLPTEIPFNIGCCQGLGTGTSRGFDSPYTIDTNSKSMFAQIEYEFNPQWTGIAGFRYIDEDKDYEYANNVVRFIPGSTYRNGNPNIIANLVSFATSRSDSLWSAKVEVDYRPNEDLLLFASWNRGTKASGFNAPFLAVGGDPNDVLPYKPEELDAFEVGFKWTFADGLARLNASAYYYDYQDYQAFDIIVLDTLTANREAEMAGFELELQASPTEGLDILFGLAYNDAEIDMGGRKTRPVQSPKWNVNGMIRYQWPMANGKMAIQGDIDYRSGTLFSLTGADTVNQGGYEVANARLSYTTSDDKWEAAVYVNNLLDEEYRVSQFDLSGNVLIDAGGVLSLVEQYYGRPRWVGGSISYNF